MAKGDKQASEIVSAAQALEDELEQLETQSRSTRKIRLNTDKNLARAASELQKTVDMPARLADRLQAVAIALGRMQERQQAAIEPLAMFATVLKQRSEVLSKHLESFGALGQAAGEVNEQLAAGRGDRTAFARAEARLAEISEAARALFEAARADDFPDVAREADVLKQRMAALAKRLNGSRGVKTK